MDRFKLTDMSVDIDEDLERLCVLQDYGHAEGDKETPPQPAGSHAWCLIRWTRSRSMTTKDAAGLEEISLSAKGVLDGC